MPGLTCKQHLKSIRTKIKFQLNIGTTATTTSTSNEVSMCIGSPAYKMSVYQLIGEASNFAAVKGKVFVPRGKMPSSRNGNKQPTIARLLLASILHDSGTCCVSTKSTSKPGRVHSRLLAGRKPVRGLLGRRPCCQHQGRRWRRRRASSLHARVLRDTCQASIEGSFARHATSSMHPMSAMRGN